MDWIKQNRFYAGYSAMMLVGILALGFGFTRRSNYNEELSKYETADRNVSLLASADLFPNQKTSIRKNKVWRVSKRLLTHCK